MAEMFAKKLSKAGIGIVTNQRKNDKLRRKTYKKNNDLILRINMRNKIDIEEELKVIGIKQFKRTSGVYVFLNIIEKMAYVGQTTDNGMRFEKHLKGMFVNSKEVLNTGTNINMRWEQNKAFEVAFFPVEYDGDTGILFDYETAMMCICRGHGCMLYNGDKDHKKDDLYRETLLSRVRKEASAVEFWEDCKQYLKSDKSDIIFNDIQSRFNKWFEKEYSNTLSNVISKCYDERIKIWARRVDTFKGNRGEFLLINSNGKINMKKELTREDMNACGITEGKTIAELFNNDEIDTEYSLWSTFGVYVTQGPLTILKTKCYDIKNFSKQLLNEDNGSNFNVVKKVLETEPGICFWSLKRWAPEHKRNLLTKYDGKKDTYKGPRMLFLSYTTSIEEIDVNSVHFGVEMQDDEICEEYLNRLKELKESGASDLFAEGYIDGSEYKAFPRDMFPMVTSKSSDKMAFLISNLYYVKDISTDIELAHFKKLFNAVFTDGTEKALCDVNSRQPCFVTELNGKRLSEKYLEENETVIHESNETKVKLIVAMLEYPYVVDVSHTPPLSQWIRGNNQTGDEKKLLFEVQGDSIGANTNVRRIIAFNDNKVLISNTEENTTLGLFSNASNETIFGWITKDEDVQRYEEFTVSFDGTGEYENIIVKDNDKVIKEVIKLNTKSNPINDKRWKCVLDKTYKYHGYSSEKDGKYWLFRTANTERKPLFLFDNIDNHNM